MIDEDNREERLDSADDELIFDQQTRCKLKFFFFFFNNKETMMVGNGKKRMMTDECFIGL